jgi:YbbR domain-containing protein
VSERPRAWGIRLLALAIAFGIWFNASVKDRLVSSERVVEAGVHYNRPRGFIIIDPVQSVNVRLAGSERSIRQLNPSQVDVQVELSQRQDGTYTVNLGADNVVVPEGLSVVSIEPPLLRVELEREETQRRKVVARLVGEPAAGAILQEIQISPDEVMVTGPVSALQRVQEMPTQAISLDGHALPFEQTVPVLSPNPLIQVLQPSKVTVSLRLEPPGSPPVGAKGKKGAP